MEPQKYTDQNHTIEPSLIDPDAIAIVHRLKKAGFIAYIVGGSVRDLLLGKTPKDYDISTSAKPEEIKKIFGRQCILIGRRFRLAHIRYGHKIYEVSTFRSGEMTEDFITQDNIWGTEQEDVLRRDFTINGLFYDPEQHAVIDYVGGRKDLENHMLHTIGDPEIRFKQDPVRMIRLIKFQARFHFKASKDVKEALVKCLPEIIKSSPARILEEILRMLESCASAPFFQLMVETGMHELLFYSLFNTGEAKEIIQYLEACDKINKQSTRFPIERPVLTSALIYPILEKAVKTHQQTQGKPPHFGEILTLCTTLIRENLLSAFTHFPRRISSLMSYVMSMQYRLTPLHTKRMHPIRLFKIREFPLALRLLKIRAVVNPELQQTYVHWREHYRQFLHQDHPHHQKRHRNLHDRHPKSGREKQHAHRS